MARIAAAREATREKSTTAGIIGLIGRSGRLQQLCSTEISPLCRSLVVWYLECSRREKPVNSLDIGQVLHAITRCPLLNQGRRPQGQPVAGTHCSGEFVLW